MAQLNENSVESISASAALTNPASHQDTAVAIERVREGNTSSEEKSEGNRRGESEACDVSKSTPVSEVTRDALLEDTAGSSPEISGGSGLNGGHFASDNRTGHLDPVTPAGQSPNSQRPIELGDDNNAVSVMTRHDARHSDLKPSDLRPTGGDNRPTDHTGVITASLTTGASSAVTSSPKPGECRQVVHLESPAMDELSPALRAMEQPQVSSQASNVRPEEGQNASDVSKTTSISNSATVSRNQQELDGKTGARDHVSFSEQRVPIPATAASCGVGVGADDHQPRDLKTSPVNVEHDCTIVAGNIGAEGLRRKISLTDAHETTKRDAGGENTSAGPLSSASIVNEGRDATPRDNITSVSIPQIIITSSDFHSKLHETASPEQSRPSPIATSESLVELKTFSKKTTEAVIPRTQNRDEPVLMHYRRRSDDDSVFYDDDEAPRATRHGNAGYSVHNGESSRRTKSTSAINAAHVDHGAGLQSGSEQRKSWENYYTLHPEVELRPKKGRGGRRRGYKEDGSRVSLTGIQVVVETTQKRAKSKPMVKLQSPRLQCCLCGCTVFSAMFGMFMLSAGVCLLLNYNFLDVDTSGLPPNLHNDEGKKVVGIILICVGIAAMVIGGLVSFLYFSSCAQRSSTTSNTAAGGSKGPGRDAENGVAGQSRSGGHHHHLNGATQGRASPALSGSRRHAGSLPNLRRGVPDPRLRSTPGTSSGLKEGPLPAYARSSAASSVPGRNGTPPTTSRSHGQKSRHGAKVKGRGRYRNPLAPHPEEAGGDTQSLSESKKSASSTRKQLFLDEERAEREEGGYINKGAQLDDEEVHGTEAMGSVSSESSATPSVIIKVDSTHVVDEEDEEETEEVSNVESESLVTSTPYKPIHTSSTSHTGDTVTFNLNGEQVQNDTGAPVSSQHRGYFNEVTFDDDESGRISRSTVDSSETLDDATNEDVTKKLDNQINRLLS